MKAERADQIAALSGRAKLAAIEELRADLYAQPDFKKLMERPVPRRYADADASEAAYLEQQLSELRRRFMTTLDVHSLVDIYHKALEIDAALADRAIGLQ